MEEPEGLFDSDYVDESHIQAFINALQSDDLDGHDALSAASPNTVPSSPVPQSPRVRKVSALSDFAPVNLKVKRKRKGDKSTGRRQEWSFLVLRWPLLFMIFILIAAQFGFYILIRQLVNTKEWLLAWRGQKGLLRKRLRGARTYQEWKEAAGMLDKYLLFDDWKQVDEDAFYDWKLLRKVNRSLKILREKNDVRGVLGVLETCVRANFVGVESSSETFLGTKNVIESYHTELESALQFVRQSSELSIEEKRRFFKNASTNMGTSALCLSDHFGVVKAFLDAGLLPRVIAGTSAGGLVAALVCTRTDAELNVLLVPELAHKLSACEEPLTVWIKRFWATGARFDSVAWARKCAFFTRGSMTFREAHLRTRRILNISVVPADRHAPTKLLNYMTAPDTIIWTALLASAAVPGILNPVVLMQKLNDGRVVPWNWGSKFKDGSLRVDIPLQALKMYFNVTHPVVSQVNPHVHLFFFAPRGSAGKPVAHRKGKGWRGNFLLSAAEQWLKLELTKNFKVIRDLELLPQLLGQDWSSVFLQRFDGAVTIWPRTRILDWLHILSDPDPAELERMMKVGQIVTWPKLHMIENRFRIENEILLGRQAVRMAIDRVRSRPNSDGQTVPDPIIGTQLPTTSARLESPIPMDSDVERAFEDNSTAWYFRRGRPKADAPRESETSTSYGNNHNKVTDPLRSPVLRRKWASDLFNRDDSVAGNSSASPRAATPEPPPADNPRQTASTPSTFFTKLRPGSLLIPFSGSHRPARSNGKSVDASELAWSSESSSEDELDNLQVQSTLHLNTYFNQEAVSDEEGVDSS
ncbi:patatin-domain-containing protein [Suillus paluster]|uniref:patatin-domain-containing protein n=1 Tax=Suillus paluster TaxID=48578 RepID=UPI001B872D72|nr:patatin-domain-containing protein [Suillus paluster]KAG1754072.1 patatin-domain-containing protein [Suillus paluster]